MGSIERESSLRRKKIGGCTRYNLMILGGGRRGAKKGVNKAFQYMYKDKQILTIKTDVSVSS